MLGYFEPGEWYTLRAGAVGKAEYLDSVVECYSVTQQRGIGTIGNTSIEFREVLENWKWDANEYTRFMAPGDPNSSPYTNVVTIGDQYCTQPVTLLCGATSCQTEINQAIQWLSQTYGGGTVKLLEGTFSISAAIDLTYDNITLEGSGWNTVISKNCDDYAIKGVGTSSTSVLNTVVRNMKVTQADADSNTNWLVFMTYVDGLTVENLLVSNFKSTRGAIVLVSCKNYLVRSNTIDNNSSSIASAPDGIYIRQWEDTKNAIVANNIVKNIYLSAAAGNLNGIEYESNYDGILSHCIIIANSVSNLRGYGVDTTPVGILVNGFNYSILSNNVVTGVKHYPTTASGVQGIYIGVGSTSNKVLNNYCFDNGLDTGLANSNGNNFYDGGTDTQVG